MTRIIGIFDNVRAIVVEDEANVRKGFVKLISRFCPEVEVVAVAENVETGLETVKAHEIDILFLDINLPDGSGFDLIHQVQDRSFHTIFVTAYNQYAVDAFKIGAIDYLLKPVAPDDIIKAVEKAKKYEQPALASEKLEIAQRYLDKKYNQSEKIILKDLESMFVVSVSEIIYCSAEGSYCTFHLSSREKITTSLNLKEYEKLLTPYSFIRCHNSYLANIEHIREVKKSDGAHLLLSNGELIPLSFRKKAMVIDSLKQKFIN